MMSLKFAAILTAVFALAQCQDRCGDSHWKEFGNSCYMFYYFEPQSWSDAQSVCKNYGSNLVSISSERENDFVADVTNGEEAWIGLRDVPPRADRINNLSETEAEKWKWTDGSPYDRGYKNWGPGQPSGLQDGVQINWGGKGKWDDLDYWVLLPFVCEKPLK